MATTAPETQWVLHHQDCLFLEQLLRLQGVSGWVQEFLWPVLRSHQRMERARCAPVLRVSWRGDGRACVALFWGGSFRAGARSPRCRWAQKHPGWSCTDREMPRSPLCRTEACKASVTHPGAVGRVFQGSPRFDFGPELYPGLPPPCGIPAPLPSLTLSPPLHAHSLFIGVCFEGFSTRLPAASGDEPRWAGICLLGRGGSSRPCHQRP